MTPVPLSEELAAELAVTNSIRTAALSEPVYGAISLAEAVARAIKFNLDYRIDSLQSALRDAERAQATVDVLPELVRTAGYTGRSNTYSTSSLDLPTGIVVDPNTVSSDREYNDEDTTFSWNILDFALSYVRARQAADKFLISQELRRKTIHRIIEDTRTAYWRAVAAQKTAAKLNQLEERVRRALAGSTAALGEGAQSPMTALSYERELVQIQQTAEQLSHELNLAKSQLAALMNLAPGTKFRLADAGQMAEPQGMDMPVKEMVQEAIFNRAEIREVAYEQRINEQEAIAAILELLPGLREYATDSFDGNSFLLHNNWLSWGTVAAGNLIKIIQVSEKSAWIDAQSNVLQQKSLAVTMVVMTQVFVSRSKYKHIQSEFKTANSYVAVQQALVEQLRAEAASGSIGEQTLIREEMNLLVAEVERDISYSELQNAAANLMVSMGLDLQGREIDTTANVLTLTGHLKASWSDRLALSDRGRYLMELEKARQLALRKKEEEERIKREEQRRVAEEAKRIHDEEVRRVKEDARLAKLEAERIRKEDAAARLEVKRQHDEALRVAKSEAERERKIREQDAKETAKRIKEDAERARFEVQQQYKAEALQKKQDADAARSEEKRIKAQVDRDLQAQKRLKDAEERQAAREADLAKLESKRSRDAEVARLKTEAKFAREAARQARKDGGASTASSTSEWLWTWEASSRPVRSKSKKLP